MAALEPGSTLAGKYVIERVLGVGGMGVVVAARHIELDQKVAIKYLLPETLSNPEIVERFAREARAAAKIRGDHVARVLDVGRFEDGSPFMVLEYLEGEDLSQLLERTGPLPIEGAVGYVLEACEALAEAHVAQIVHRDLKPANLFLARRPDRRSIVKVLDFGISKFTDSTKQALTNTSAIMGTPHYMSPEQLIASKRVDARSDIWALGVILYELISDRKPFSGETMPEIIGAILTNEPVRLSSLQPHVSLDLELVIARCMRTKPDERHASVKELAIGLLPFASMAQRETVEKIARVLGASLRPAQDSPSDLGERSTPPSVRQPPPPAFAETALVASPPPSVRSPAAKSLQPDTSPAVTAMVVEPPTVRRWMSVAVAIVVLGASSTAALFVNKRYVTAERPAETSGLVGIVGPAPAPPILSVAPPTSALIMPEVAPSVPSASPAATPSGRTKNVRGIASAVPALSAAPPPAAPEPTKNPLNMGLK